MTASTSLRSSLVRSGHDDNSQRSNHEKVLESYQLHNLTLRYLTWGCCYCETYCRGRISRNNRCAGFLMRVPFRARTGLIGPTAHMRNLDFVRFKRMEFVYCKFLARLLAVLVLWRRESKGSRSHYLRARVLGLVPRRCQLLATTQRSFATTGSLRRQPTFFGTAKALALTR